MAKVTEEGSKYNDLEQMSIQELLFNINKEDAKVAHAVTKVIPQVEAFVAELIVKLRAGGRLFYLGAGTSGRLGILDASECPPTFGVSSDVIIGMMAGGDRAIRKAVEHAEDNTEQAWKDLSRFQINSQDVVFGISASGSTPYVLHGLKKCSQEKILTASLSCNKESLISKYVDHPIEVIVGPEFLTGSTRMKAGTAQKLILNMISTSSMIKLGHVLDNKMIDMQLSNNKLIERAIKMIIELKGLGENEAKQALKKYGSVRKVIENY